MSTLSRRALVGALALTLTAAPAVMAADITETLVVANAITAAGLPASIDYGTVAPGATSATVLVDANVTANSPWRLDVSGSDFARAGGGTLDKSARQGQISTNAAGQSAGVVIDPDPYAFHDFGSAQFTDAAAEATGPVTATPLLVRTEVRVAVPMGTLAGTYTGVLTVTVSPQ